MLKAFQGVAAIGLIALLLPALTAGADEGAAPPAPAGGKIDAARDVLPILSKRCQSCHGARRQEGGLRLDDRAGLLKGGEHGPAAVAGKGGESLLVEVVGHARDDIKVRLMPRKGDPLTEDEIKILRSWIDQGAEWPEAPRPAARDPKLHWAFRAPVRPPVPKVLDSRWVRTPIDAFVLARIEKEGLAPSEESDRITLLRRLSLDLIGLPPSVEEVDAFLADPFSDAYEKQVERLLESPHYGERWGRHWLDAARYADSDGFEKDMSRNVWPYRDWVLGALNRDMPYDRFIIAQLAGDQLPDATQEDIVATGFLRNSMQNEEGGVDPEQFRMDAMFDRMDCIGKSVLGLTIQCAQCHNHKFDPLSQEEYYRLFSFLNNDHEPLRAVYSPDETMNIERIRRGIREIEADLRHRTPDWADRMAEWEKKNACGQPEWTVLQPVVEEISTGGQKYRMLSDGSFIAEGYKPTKHTVEMKVQTPLARITAFRLEQLTDPNLPRGGPGRSSKGLAALTEFKVEAADAKEPEKRSAVKFASATADFANDKAPLEAIFDDKSGKTRVTGKVEYAIDGKDDTAWGIDAGPGRRNQERKAVFRAEKPIEFPGGAVLIFHLEQNHGGWNSDDHQNQNLGRFRLSATGAADAAVDPLPQRVRDILAVPRENRTPAQTDAVFSFWRTTVDEWKEANQKIEALWKEFPEGTTALTLLARDAPRDTRMLKRGDWLQPDKAIQAGVPAFLHPLPEGAPTTRLTLARWLVDAKSPTTARVLVNRIWQAYFGTGLVATSEDFGMQSEMPSHPELLDWLACELMDGGWKLKRIHRLIVGSATYREASRVTPDGYERDPYNRLLARGARLRVEGEIVRDIFLSASGLLVNKVGGPSIFSPAPPSLFLPPASYAPFTWIEATGPDRYRRALYTFRRRSTPYPMLQTFDAPNGDFACVRRMRSNTPLQALTTLNEPVFMECARALALRAVTEGGKSDQERIAFCFRRCLSRRPTDDETQELLGLLGRVRARLAEGWTNPLEAATGKNEKPAGLPDGTTPTQLGALAIVSRVILNLDETITKE